MVREKQITADVFTVNPSNYVFIFASITSKPFIFRQVRPLASLPRPPCPSADAITAPARALPLGLRASVLNFQ